MLATPPMLTLNNGVQLPALGFGVFQTPPDVTQAAVEEALRVGYRLIDTAASYLNEREVGAGIAASGVDRSELFVQTKAWVSDYSFDGVIHAFDVSTRKLGLETVDLYFLHQPLPQHFESTVAAYKGIERLLSEGRARAIGVSNFSAAHLERFLPEVEVVPAVNQVEVHPYYAQPALRAVHERLGIVTQAWSPLGGVYVYRPADPDSPKSALADPVIDRIAQQHGKTPAQVILRWHVDSGRAAVPKSVRPDRIIENFSVLDFELTPAEVGSIDALDTGVRGGPNQDEIDFLSWNRTIPD
ncbi:MAG TPA: aldo/keto reductase [Candidatus Limnocylindrales bacterium]|jgi:diketogulonate reductase-like aldo/keto reductase